MSITRTGHSTHITPATRGYARRQPEDTVLYGVVQDHLATLLDTARDRSEHGFGYPRFVEREFEKFLACGLLCHGSLLNLNCHAHALLPDGVFAAGSGGAVRFHPLPPPWDDDVARLLGQVARAIHRLVERRLAQRGDDEPPDLLPPNRPKPSPGHPRSADPAPLLSSTGRRSAFLEGYSLHADHLIDANDRDSLERLCRYGARSSVANTRLSLDPSGRVVVSLKRPLRDGRTELAFTPIDFLRRLASLIPPPRRHLTRYHGVFAPNQLLSSRELARSASPPPEQPHATAVARAPGPPR